MNDFQQIFIINKIILMALLVNETTNHTVFFRYSGHIDTFQLDVYEGGWARDKDNPVKELTAELNSNRKKEFNAMLSYLTDLYTKELEKIIL